MVNQNGFKELPVVSAGPAARAPGAQDPIIGIDLGTTNSLAAVAENGVVRVLRSREGKSLLPSVVFFDEGDQPVVGFAAKEKRSRFPKRTVFSAKRLLGRGAADASEIARTLPFDLDLGSEQNVKIAIGGSRYTPIEISAFILREIKAAAEEQLGRKVEDAVITVPAYFNDSQRQATRAAGRLAGLNVIRILNEPTAASLAYGIQKKKEGVIAVYDFGGGTFDVSILKLRDGVFEVLATAGDTLLGGDDIDQAIAGRMASATGGKPEHGALLKAAEELKIQLTEKDRAVAQIPLDGGKSAAFPFSRAELSELTLPILEKTKAPVFQALADAGLQMRDLTEVVLVGGPTRMPALKDFVRDLFRKEPNCSLNPDEVVAIGAAVQADILAGNNRDLLLLDVVPLSLGMETLGGTMNKLIARNTRIPALAKEQFTTYAEGQTKVAVNVYQGERDLVAHNRKLGEFVLSDIPPLPAGMARIEVLFLVDADGILSVSAKELHSGVEQSIEIRPAYGLTDAQVEAMLSDYLQNQQSDLREARLIEERNDARAVLIAAEKSLPKVQDRMPSEEVRRVADLLFQMKRALEGKDVEAIKKARKELNEGTRHMAELLMQTTLDSSFKNKEAGRFEK